MFDVAGTGVTAAEINPENRPAFSDRQGRFALKMLSSSIYFVTRETLGAKRKAANETNERITQFKSTSLQTRRGLFKLHPLPDRHLPGTKRVKRTKRTKRVQRIPPAWHRSH
jgi:hypothetical protein